MRKSAVLEAGGYDPSLRARSAEGLEDYQLYFRIATRHKFSVVPEHLTGYRRMPNSMSADVFQMLRSRDLLAEEMCSKYPEHMSEVRASRLYFLSYLYEVALGNRRGLDALRMAALLVWESPLVGISQAFVMAARSLARATSRSLARRIRRTGDGNMPAGGPRFPVATAVSRDRRSLDVDAPV